MSGTSAATGREWKKRDFFVEHIAPETNYKDRICISAFGDKISNIPAAGTSATFRFYISARDTSRGVFNSVNFVDFTPAQTAASQPQQPAAPSASSSQIVRADNALRGYDASQDELPF